MGNYKNEDQNAFYLLFKLYKTSIALYIIPRMGSDDNQRRKKPKKTQKGLYEFISNEMYCSSFVFHGCHIVSQTATKDGDRRSL